MQRVTHGPQKTGSARCKYRLQSYSLLMEVGLTAVILLAALMAVPKFYDVDAKAGLLLLPYIGWTCFSSTLINCSLQKRSSKQVLNRSPHT